MINNRMDTKMHKTALIIAYYYPPTNNGGVQRPASFAKYLPDYGYKPIILTCQTPEAPVSEAGVFRVPDPGIKLSNTGGLKYFAFRVMRKVLFKSGAIPGNLYWWYKEVLKNVELIIEEQQPDIILATYPPHENLMIGMEISRKYNIPLVLDFRDGMVFEALGSEPFTVRLRERTLERKLLNSSVWVVSVTPSISDYFAAMYPECKRITISNGYDPEEWAEVKKLSLGERINIVYTGRFSISRKGTSIKSLIQALDSLNETEKKRLCIHMVGDFSVSERSFMQKTYPGLFNFVGFVDRSLALQYQRSADLLLLVTALGQSSVATGKLFEYLAAGRPILAITKGTAAEEIINRTGTGVCLSPADVDGITRQLKNIIKGYPEVDFYKPVLEEIQKYNRKILTRQLAGVFDEVLGVD